MNRAGLRGIGMTSQRTRERLVTRLRAQGIGDEEVLDTIRRTPRHIFVDEALASRAYEETALPIGNSQTISQPYTVARMTELIVSKRPRRVLEVGTGSGYQTAILAQLVERVYTVERIRPLVLKARPRLEQLGLRNVFLRVGDGYLGWPEQGPFDAVLVTAAPDQVPTALLAQLAEGGQMVIPVGPAGGQRLLTIQRQEGSFVERVVEPVSFVPMVVGIEA